MKNFNNLKTKLSLILILLAVIGLSNNTFAINAPSITSPSNGATNQDLLLYIDWTSIIGNEGYVYQLDTVSDFSSALLIQDTTGTDVSYKQLSNLFFGKTYYWRVMTLSSGGNSVWSSTWSFTTKSTVNNVSPDDGVTNQEISLYINWSDISGNSGYIYQVDTSSTFNSSLFLQGTTSTNNSFVGLSDLLFGTTYYWRACAKSVNDTSNWSNTWSFTTKSTVNNISPDDGVTNQEISLYINWTDISGNSGYIYQVDTSSTFNSSLFLQGTTSTNNSFVGLSDLLFGTTYYWRACAKSVNDTSEWSLTWHFSTKSTVDITSPSNGAINQDTSLYIDWTDITGNDGYIYQIDTSQNFNSTLVQQGVTAQNSSFVLISDLLYGTTYYWRACAKSNIDTSDWSNTWHFKTSYQLTSAPNLISPVNGSTEISYLSTDLEWSSVAGATTYQYQYSEDSTFYNGVYSGTTGSLTETITNLNETTTYFWRVRGQNTSGYSPWSTVWKFTTDNNVGISCLSNMSYINIFPNPTKNVIKFRFNINSNEVMVLNIYNVMGTLIKTEILKQNQQQIDITNLTNGIYMVEIKSKEWTEKQKLIIQR